MTRTFAEHVTQTLNSAQEIPLEDVSKHGDPVLRIAPQEVTYGPRRLHKHNLEEMRDRPQHNLSRSHGFITVFTDSTTAIIY